jgi:RDD family
MTTPRPARPLTPLEIARGDVERMLGPGVAKRVEAFKDGSLYVRAGEGVRLLAWVVDFVVFVLSVAIGIVVIAGIDSAVDLDDNVVALSLIGALVLAPLLYGLLCYRNGRALGGVTTGTRLVRASDGGRIGAAGPWAMFVRTLLLPLLIVAVVLGGTSPGGSLSRVAVDAAATRELHDAGFWRLGRVAPHQHQR